MWAAQSDEALIAQGRASARGAAAFAQFGVPMLAGLQEAFAEGARMLDVGTGVAAMAVAFAELFPRLTVVGIDVMPRVLGLAEQTVAASSVGDRIILREQDVSSLDEPATYALAWLPAPFIPASLLGAGVLRVVESLRPGGWLMLGHGKYGGSAVNDAIGRFKTIAYGGTALNDEEAEGMLRSAGLVDVRTVPTPQGAPAITVGRKPMTSRHGPSAALRPTQSAGESGRCTSRHDGHPTATIGEQQRPQGALDREQGADRQEWRAPHVRRVRAQQRAKTIDHYAPPPKINEIPQNASAPACKSSVRRPLRRCRRARTTPPSPSPGPSGRGRSRAPPYASASRARPSPENGLAHLPR